ncbi:geobacillin-26 family protein [Alicyclobacillus tolerans]|uniref:geobacillin-26 family protein n=1 Tax=Alicyclobacillus tolerans TaxID=90970 RepID=UPI003B7714A9
MKTILKKIVGGVFALSTMIGINIPSAYASTSQLNAVGNKQSFSVNGNAIYVQKMSNGNPFDNVVRVTVNGQTTTVTYNKITKTMTVLNSNNTQQTFNLTDLNSGLATKKSTAISPNYISERVSEQWWGDYAQDSIFSGSTQYWMVAINSNNTSYAYWSGAETSNNSSVLNNYWSAVSATENSEYAFYAATGLSASSALVSVITSETGVGAIVGVVVAAGFAIGAAYEAAQAWTDHHTDVVDFYQIPGA